MKIIQHINGVVVDVRGARDDATGESIAVVDSIPAFEPKEGYNGELRYSEDGGLYWEYIECAEEQEISDSEALEIILGGETA